MAVQTLSTSASTVSPVTTMGGNVDIYCKVTGVTGESQDANHVGWIIVDSISGGVANAGASAYGSGSGSGKSQWQDLTIRCKFDSCYPTLMQFCASGSSISTVTISACKAGGTQQEFLNIKLTEAIISSLSMVGTQSTEPLFDCSFNFSQIVVTGTPQSDTGTVGASTVAGWNVKQNIKV